MTEPVEVARRQLERVWRRLLDGTLHRFDWYRIERAARALLPRLTADQVRLLDHGLLQRLIAWERCSDDTTALEQLTAESMANLAAARVVMVGQELGLPLYTAASVLKHQYSLRRLSEDLEARLQMAQQAVSLSRESYNLPLFQYALAEALLDRFGAHRDRRDLDTAIHLARAAVEHTAPSPNRTIFTQVLRRGLKDRYFAHWPLEELANDGSPTSSAGRQRPMSMEAAFLLDTIAAKLASRELGWLDSQALADEIGRLPALPSTEHVEALITELLVSLALWEQQKPDRDGIRWLAATAQVILGVLRDRDMIKTGIFWWALATAACCLLDHHAVHLDPASLEVALRYTGTLADSSYEGELRLALLRILAVRGGEQASPSGTSSQSDANGHAGASVLELQPARALLPARLEETALSSHQRYEECSEAGALVDTIRLYEHTLALKPPGVERARLLSNLAVALGDLYARERDPAIVERRIGLLEEARSFVPPFPLRKAILTNLASALEDRYNLYGEPADLNGRISRHEEVLGLYPEGPLRARYLRYLGAALSARFQLNGDPADLERQIGLLEEAASAASPESEPERASCLSDLGAALGQRYRLRGEMSDMQRQIDLLEEAVPLASSGPQRANWLGRLSYALLDRYHRQGDPDDLNRCIRLSEEALDLTPPRYEDDSWLASLEAGLAARYHLLGDPADLERRIQLLEEIVALAPSGPNRAGRLNNLGLGLHDRFVRRGNCADLIRAIDLGEEALGLSPSGPGRAPCLRNLAHNLGHRYDLWGDSTDLKRQIDLLEQAVALTPAGVHRPTYLTDLARALLHSRHLSFDVADLARYLVLLGEALSLSRPLEGLEIARALAITHRSLATNGHGDVARQYGAATIILQKGLASLEQLLTAASEKHESVLLSGQGELYDLLVDTHLRLADLASDSGDAASMHEHHRAAYLAAERSKGRRAAALLATQAVQPQDATVQKLLPRIEHLREELARLLRQMGRPDHGDDDGGRLRDQAPTDPAQAERWTSSAASSPTSADQDTPKHRSDAVWAELRKLLDEVARADPNYASVRGFAEPKPPKEIASALPANGTLVLLYPLADGLTYFVLRPGPSGADTSLAAGRVLLEQPGSDPETGATVTLQGQAALAALVERALPKAAGGLTAIGGTLDMVLEQLAKALYPAIAPQLPAPDPDNPASLVLVPTGALHRLPLHALPWPDRRQRLLDGYAVSYASSADVLVLASQKRAATAGLVALAPGLSDLPDGSGLPDRPVGRELAGALAEAAAVAGASGQALLRTRASLRALLEAKVAQDMRWVVLGTHGLAGGPEHARSGLLLYDEAELHGVWLTAQEIMARLPLEGVEHAGLGACSAHALDPTPGDRLAGLVRALLYRGARSVGATLWPVRDDAAALVGAWTFEALLGGEQDKARALRSAVQHLRRCSGTKAAAELRRLAESLPEGDPARAAVEAMASELAGQQRPFGLTADWAPFVLHGAPRTTTASIESPAEASA